MAGVISLDEDLLRRLPLPLAHLYRRAHNAKTALERHHAAYYLWEAALKLLGSVAVVEYAELGDQDPELAGRLQNLARPSLGHWWEFVRRLTPLLADRGAVGFAAVRELLLGKSRPDLPHAAGLDAVLVQVLEGREEVGARATVRLSELFDRLVRYRNREFGHGATGQKPTAFYERVGRALLAGVPEVLARLDCLAGRRLLYVADVRRQASGRWLVERFELRAEAPRRLESLDLPDGDAARRLAPERLYLESVPLGGPSPALAETPPGGAETARGEGRAAGDQGPQVVSLHPLLVYDPDAGEALFLNARRGRQRIEYLSYSTGRELERADLAQEQRELLARLLHAPVDPARGAEWAARSQAEEESEGPREEAPAAPRRLGEFELLSELGRGGMGVVYRAWQPSLGRQVAVKALFRTGDPKAEARFAREIRALGHVEHPHLIRIFTSGSDGEQWFYAMEVVEGATLAAVCEKLQSRSPRPETIDLRTWRQAVSTVCSEARQAEKPVSDAPAAGGEAIPAAPAPGRGADRSPVRVGQGYVRQAVELVRQVAEAAHALHERGVLHRDIKPGNVMVTADAGQSVLMDLGLAQIADEVQGRLTKTRQFVGTLRYASPEQVLAVGGLDRRSDVYSLGASLWELITLRPMFGATDQTPTPELMRRIQYEEPERPRKYHPRLSRDLEAVVLKCLEKDPGRRYATARDLARDLERCQAGEPVQARPISSLQRGWRWCRRRPAVAAMLAVLVVVILGSLAGLYALYLNADRQRQLAEHREAGELAIRKFYQDYVLAAPRPKGFEGGASPQVTLREALDRAAPQIDPAFAGHPDLEAAVRHSLGVTYLFLGRYAAARDQLDKAYRTRLTLLGPEHPDTVESEYELAEAYFRVEKYDDSERLYRDVIDRGRRVLGSKNEDVLYAPLKLGSVLESKGQYPEAETLLRQGIEDCKLTLSPDHHHSFCGQARLADVLSDEGRADEALALKRETYEGRRRVLGEDAYDTLLSLGELGSMLRNQGKLDEAEPILRKNLGARTRVLGPEHNDTLYAKHHVAFLLEAQGKYPEAEQLHREALAVWQRAYGPEEPDTLTCQGNLAWNLVLQGKLDDAAKLYEHVLETQRRVLGPAHADTLYTLWSLADLRDKQGRPEEAEKLYRELIQGDAHTYGPEHRATVGRKVDLAFLLEKEGKAEEAIALWREVLAARRKTSPPDDLDLAMTLVNFGALLADHDRAAEAEPLLREGLAIRDKKLPPEDWRLANTRSILGGALARQGKFAEAEPLVVAGCEDLSKAKDAPPVWIGQGFDRVIGLYEKWGKPEQAEDWRKKRPDPAK